MFTEEQQQKLVEQCLRLTQKITELNVEQVKATAMLNLQTALLKSSAESIAFLVDFIKQHGIVPPVLPEKPSLIN